MSFADELRKKADSAPKEEQNAENRYMNEIYFSLKEGIVRCFLRKCYEEASRGETQYAMFIDFIHIIGIIHEQERTYVKESDFNYVKHVLKINKDDLKAFLLNEMKKNELINVKVTVRASKMLGYFVKISVSW